MLKVNTDNINTFENIDGYTDTWNYATDSNGNTIALNSSQTVEDIIDDILHNYLEYNDDDTLTDESLFNYILNSGRSGTYTHRLDTDVGWSYLEIYQDSNYYNNLKDKGNYNYTDLEGATITSLFSRSVYIQVQDDAETIDTIFTKIDGDTVTNNDPDTADILSNVKFNIYSASGVTTDNGTVTSAIKGDALTVTTPYYEAAYYLVKNSIVIDWKNEFSSSQYIEVNSKYYISASGLSTKLNEGIEFTVDNSGDVYYNGTVITNILENSSIYYEIDNSVMDVATKFSINQYFTSNSKYYVLAEALLSNTDITIDAIGNVEYSNTIILTALTSGTTYTVQLVSSDSSGIVYLDNLEYGKTYWVEEITTIDGYDISTWYWLVTIATDGTVTYTTKIVNTEDTRDTLLTYTDSENKVTYYWPNYKKISISFIKIDGYSVETDSSKYVTKYNSLENVIFNIFTATYDGDNYVKGTQLTNADNTVYQVKSDSEGKVTFENLEINTTYWIEEVSSVDGYEKATWHWIVVVDSNGDASFTSISDTSNGVTKLTDSNGTNYWPNYTVYTLPKTGGIGIYWFVMIGVLMMLSSSMIWLYRYRYRRKDIKI